MQIGDSGRASQSRPAVKGCVRWMGRTACYGMRLMEAWVSESREASSFSMQGFSCSSLTLCSYELELLYMAHARSNPAATKKRIEEFQR